MSVVHRVIASAAFAVEAFFLPASGRLKNKEKTQ